MIHRIVLAFVLLTTATIAQTTRPARLDDLRSFVGGEWKTQGQWANGTPLRAAMTFESMLGDKFLLARGFLIDDAGTRQPRDISIFSIADGQLVQHVYAADGAVRQAAGKIEKEGEIVFEWSRANPDGTSTPVKQIIRIVDADTTAQQFKMLIKGEWHTLLDTTWRRQK